MAVRGDAPQGLWLGTATALSPCSGAEWDWGLALGGMEGSELGGNQGPAEPGPSCRQ